MIFLLEILSDSKAPQNDEKIMINGYSLLRADHRSDCMHGGVCLYFKEHLALIRRNDLSILQECLVTEVIVDNEKYFFIWLYRSPNQNYKKLENLSSN